MLDLFTIFTKGGIVLWYFQGTALSLTPAVNALIKSVILQERVGVSSFNYESLTLKFRLENEFDLIFVVAYQRVIQLAYTDKLLDQVQLEFRDRYKNELADGTYSSSTFNFTEEFQRILQGLEREQQSLEPRPMRTFEQSRKFDRSLVGSQQQQAVQAKPPRAAAASHLGLENGTVQESSSFVQNKASLKKLVAAKATGGGRRGAAKKQGSQPGKALSASPKAVRKGKQNRVWDGVVSREEAEQLDHSQPGPAEGDGEPCTEAAEVDFSMVGQMEGSLKPVEEEGGEGEAASKKSSSGLLSFFKGLTMGKVISQESMAPVLDRMREHLITKNVAVEIADKLCESVAAKLDGKVIGTFSGIQATVRASMAESLVQILSPKCNIDVLRNVAESREQGRPYVITFCGVNGVGKSTNLAKVAFWLLENGFKVLIAACDTFRSGAVEQLRTHVRHLGSLQGDQTPPRVMLYERGYGKDAAAIAMDAIAYARQQAYDAVLVDTAGRMQNNEPLMRALAKLIRENRPDLVLFVGEALVGNEAVDQLSRFNQALVDYSNEQDLRAIDGIVLTKFDTIDDKVGAAISMTYTTGQPIVFVGTGQRYVDLKSLNVQAVVTALFK